MSVEQEWYKEREEDAEVEEEVMSVEDEWQKEGEGCVGVRGRRDLRCGRRIQRMNKQQEDVCVEYVEMGVGVCVCVFVCMSVRPSQNMVKFQKKMSAVFFAILRT